ncbi:MAG: Veg family protein [Clostridia bacterium]
MREIIGDITSAKQMVCKLKGRQLLFEINKGRNKFEKHNGFIKDIYPSIFTMQVVIDSVKVLMTFPYSDVLTKNIKFFV